MYVMLFLAVAGALLFLIYKKEVGLFMKQSDGKRGGILLGTFVWACIGIGYCLVHYDDVPEAKLVSDAEIVLPDGYDISSQKVVKAYFVCSCCNKQTKTMDPFHHYDKRVVILDNGRKLAFSVNSPEFDKWDVIKAGDVCSYVKKTDKLGVLLEDFYFPVAPQFVCYDDEEDNLYYL